MAQDTEPSANAASPAWQPRRYRPGDEAELAMLFGRVFQRPVTPDWWLWKMHGIGEACKNVWVGESATGRLMAQYAGIPVDLQIAGVTRPAMVSVDTMTAPEFRKRGVLSQLGRLAYSDWAEQGKVAILGLPNQQWGSRTTALGWEQLFPLAWLRFPLHIEKALARSPRVPALLRLPAAGAVALGVLARYKLGQAKLVRQSSEISVSPIGSDITAIDEVWDLLSPYYRNTIVRNGAWIKWRFLEAVDTEYKVLVARRERRAVGYIVFRLAGDEKYQTGLIADIFAAPDDVATVNALLHAALADMWDAGAVTARTTASLGSSIHRHMVAAGFTPLEASFSFDMVLLDPSLNPGMFSNPQEWQLSGGDFDII